MAWFNEVDGSSYSNVATTVSGDISSISHSGGTVTMTYRIRGKNTSQWSQNSMVFWVNGTKHFAFNNSGGGSSHTTVGSWYYTGYETQSFSVPASSTSFTVSIPMSQKYWNPSSAAGSVTLTVSGVPVSVSTPTINNPSVTNISRTGANASFSVANNGGASIVDNYIDCGTYNFGNVVSTISSTSGSFSGLTPNTTYYVRANASNGTYRGYSSVVSFKTTHNNPTIGDRTVTFSRAKTALNSKMNIVVSYSTTYDNASYSSHKLEYGTSTSYGSTATSAGTGGSSKFNINNLEQNTTYYYRITETDNTSQSSTATGSFTTPPGARVVTSNGVTNARVKVIR